MTVFEHAQDIVERRSPGREEVAAVYSLEAGECGSIARMLTGRLGPPRRGAR